VVVDWRCRRGGEGRRCLPMLERALWGNERGEMEEGRGFWIWMGHL
jgi:hypothetical protein